MRRIIFFLILISCSSVYPALPCAWGPKIEVCKPQSLIPENYALIDLGEITLAPELLDRFATPQTYAPRINNKGVVAYNNDGKAIVRKKGLGELFPEMNGTAAQCFGLNDKGEILLSLPYSNNRILWSVWVTENLRKVKEVSIFGEGVEGSNLYLRTLNNHGIAVGALRPAGKLRPLYWSPTEGLHHLGYFFGWDLEGIAWDVNDNGTVVGTFYPPNCEPQIFIPFVWSKKWGLERLHGYRQQMELQLRRPLKDAEIQFSCPLIDQEDVVYGQVTIDDVPYRYTWYSHTNEILLGEWGQLKLNVINNNFIFAGSMEGEAVLYQRYLQPILLSKIVGNLSKDWELIEITDSNDQGALVGFGKFKGVYHLFQAVPSLGQETTSANIPDPELLKYPLEELNTSPLLMKRPPEKTTITPQVDHMNYIFEKATPSEDNRIKMNLIPFVNEKE